MNSLLKNRSLRLVIGAGLVSLVLAGFLALHERANTLHPALDALVKIPLADRWSHPAMLKIRALGPKAVPDLRRALAEKDSLRTHFLLWLQGKWPKATNYISDFPELTTLSERCWAACQALRSLGSAARPAAPELIQVFRRGDISDWNAASMALHAIGIDSEIAEQLAALAEEDVPDNAKPQIFWMFSGVKIPTPRMIRVLIEGLKSDSPWVQSSAIEVMGRFRLSTPEIIKELEIVNATTTNSGVFMSSAATLWIVRNDKEAVFEPAIQRLEEEIRIFQPSNLWGGNGGNGGQGIDGTEQVFLKAGDLFVQLPLTNEEKARALSALERFSQKNGRIFVRMCLLPDMMKLGYPASKALQVCEGGLDSEEDYYQIQAAHLLSDIAEEHSVDSMDLDNLIRHRYVGVRVFAAKAHWLARKRADQVVPLLVDALDRKKHESYYYPEIQRTALQVLGLIGSGARQSASALEQLKDDPDPAVAQLAAEALSRVTQQR